MTQARRPQDGGGAAAQQAEPSSVAGPDRVDHRPADVDDGGGDELEARRDAFRAELGAALGRRPRVLLVSANPNLTTFVSPYGLELLAASLEAELDAEVRLVDPFLPGSHGLALTAELLRFAPDVVGINFRNLDLAYAADIERRKIVSQSCVPALRVVLARLAQAHFPRERTIIGGTGLAAAPRELLRAFELPYGVVGPGAESIVRFVRAVVLGASLSEVPGLVTAEDEAPPRRLGDARWDNDLLPRSSAPHRAILRQRRVLFPLRTASGCGMRCSYCIEGQSQARKARARGLARIAAELDLIRGEGAERVMLADGELNTPYSDVHEHTLRLIGDAGLSWRAYCLARRPSPELLQAMRRSRCEGVLLTVDSAADQVLTQIARPGAADTMLAALDDYVTAGLPVTASLLFGLPGETDATLAQTFALVRAYPQVTFTYSCGARIYPSAPLAERARRHPEHVYRERDDDPLAVAVYSEPCPPWELAARVRDALADVRNAERFW